MKKLNPIERSKYINERYKEYLRSSFEFGKSQLQRLFVEQLEKEKLFKGPYVDMSFPFQRGQSLNSLVDNGILCKSFYKLEDIDFDRPLYSHQEESINLIKSGRSAVITTGTGSGKTECFLYPILNQLLSDVEKGNNEVGIRAIFLYPMNALVNDQIDRIRKILKNCPEITFGFFTGETPEKASANDRIKLSKENDIEITNNELISREEIRENPPHLLFTNYSMLEYLLIRPNDYAIFEPERLKNWKYVVLDEAHTYYGSLGIEISLLLRRLTGLAPKKPQFILTSATLGNEGESEQDIIRFASNLTATDFTASDIIFSKRVPLKQKPIYRVSGTDYTAIQAALKSFDDLKQITSKYCKSTTDNINELLYDLLSQDENVHDLSSILNERSRDFLSIYNMMQNNISQEELIILIDLINTAEKEGVGLFDLKYHSFVRPLSGAYITYGKTPTLSLTKTNEIDGMKAFEIGNCRYCNSPYIIGKIQKNNQDQMYYLLQNKEIDIYENYGSEDFVQIDYFLLENAINEEEVEKDNIEAYEICAKCGEIHLENNLNAKKCKCGENYHFLAYKVLQNKKKDVESIYNNIQQCPCCGHRAQSGVVKALNIGKDEGTALIAQMLYEAIDEGEEEVKKIKKISLKPTLRTLDSNNDEKVKQFLAFSDSRQQASFAAIFFDANHVRMLRKRLIWEIIKDNNYGEISIDKMTAYLEERIRTNNLFQNEMSAHKNAWAAVLVDLLKVDGSYDGEGLGLYYFDLDINNILNILDEGEIASTFAGCNMTKEKLYTFIQLAFNVFKITPAINYVKSTLTPDEKKDILEYRRFSNYVALKNPKKSRKSTSEENISSWIRSFLPVSNETNMIVRYAMKAFDTSSDTAKEMLEIIFNLFVQTSQLEESDRFFIKHEKKDAYQIDASRYIIKNYKNAKFYQCDKCGILTPHNINNKCVKDNCLGELSEIDPDEVLATNYYRQQYKNKKIERIVVKEHTAQLDRATAKQYQNDFVNKKINILSCSTTFEMGIDIGALETVFMRNVPPTPANYVQRAGRAGRRKDSSAYILTYCGVNSHDYTYFSEPEKMISGRINPPYFNVLNNKIISRHLIATSLGYFFRAYPEYYESLDALVFGGGIDKFKEYVDSKPEDLNAYINNKILPETIYSKYKNFKWFDGMRENDEKMNYFVQNIYETLNEYENARDEAAPKAQSGDIEASKNLEYFNKQIKSLKEKDVLTSLAKYCVIPKYGFPVDVIDLQIYENGIATTKYDMNRDLKIGISEYAPDSEVVVDGNKYVSKYITLKQQSEFPKNYFITCPKCKKINIFLDKTIERKCKYCNESLSTDVSEYYIEPVYGFKSDKTKESTRLKPKRSYSGEVSYIGNGRKEDKCLVFGNTMKVETSNNDELLIMNKSGFYMCPVCGYSDIVKGIHKSTHTIKKHKNYKQFDCTCDVLNYLRLGHKFKTDVTRFTIPALSSMEKAGYPQALSFLYAFLEGTSIALGIERGDIDGVLEMNLDYQSFDVLLYDNVPGGAGHVKRLLDKKAVIKSLESALGKISKECCDENTSCYNCLRNYNNQSYHNRLQRKLAIDFIKRLLYEIGKTSDEYQHWNANVSPPNIMKLTLGNDGRNPGNESADEIWSDLLDDCFDEDEVSLIKRIKENSPKNILRPFYNKTVRIEETNEEFLANLIWDSKQVILFLNDAYDDYLIAKKTGWHVFCTKEGFDIEELLKKVGI